MAEPFWKQNTISLSEIWVQRLCSRKKIRQLFVFTSVFKKKEMAIDHLFRGVSIALSMNKHVPKAPKKKNTP